MRKYHTVLHAEMPRPRRRSPAFFAAALVLIAAPFCYEGGLIVLAKWQSMTGAYCEPRTPVLDALSGWARVMNTEIRGRAWASVSRGNWNPSLAVPIAVLWAVVAAYFLRRGAGT